MKSLPFYRVTCKKAGFLRFCAMMNQTEKKAWDPMESQAFSA
jgi:hypothetical protein